MRHFDDIRHLLRDTRHIMLARLAILACACLPASAGRADYFVATNGTSGTFTTWADAATNIQAAVDAATNGATVWVSNGVYIATNIVRSNATVVIEKNITLRSVNGPEVTIMDAAAAPGDERLVLYVRSVGAVVDGFTIRGGHLTNAATPGAFLTGGGVQIYNDGTVRNCHITSNTGYSAGGAHIRSRGRIEDCWIYANTSMQTVESAGGVRLSANGGFLSHCVISNNYSYGQGGGIYAANIVTISVCTVVGNTALSDGGGIFVNSGPLVTDCPLIANNQSSGMGGGILLRATAAWNCNIISNHALTGGGVATHTAGGVLSNCYLAGNVSTSATTGGGGVYLQTGELHNNRIVSNICYASGGGIRTDARVSTSRNCLVVGNVASNQGGGMFFGSTATSLVENCTITGNTATNGGGTFFMTQVSRLSMINNSIIYHNIGTVVNDDANQNANVYVSNTCVSVATEWPDSGNIAAPPLFQNAGAGDYRLSRGSPCRDAGANQEWMIDALDLAGAARLDKLRHRVDMGCFERMPDGLFFGVR